MLYNLNETCMLCSNKAEFQSTYEYENIRDDGYRILGKGFVYACKDHFKSLEGNKLVNIPKPKEN